MARGEDAGERTVLDEEVLVVDDRDVFLGQVLDLPVFDLPQLLGDLRDETCKHRQHTRDDSGRITYGSRARR